MIPLLIKKRKSNNKNIKKIYFQVFTKGNIGLILRLTINISKEGKCAKQTAG